MKIFPFLLAILLSANQNLAAADDFIRIDLKNTETLNLALPHKNIIVSLAYPGLAISGICYLDIVADSYHRDIPIENLLQKVSVERVNLNPNQPDPDISIVSSTTIRIHLLEQSYVDGIKLSVKPGSSSLQDAISQSLGKRRTVVVMPRAC